MEKNVKIFASICDSNAYNQIYNLLLYPPLKNEQVRIMCDVHFGSNCVVGFTSTYSTMIIPNIIGVDIGCGMLVIKFRKDDINLQELDNYIKNNIPYGSKVYKTYREESIIKKLICYKSLFDLSKALKCCGSLGGGNHFIEIDKDTEGYLYLIIHSGSRNLGLQVAHIYQNIAIKYCKEMGKDEKRKAIDELKEMNNIKGIDKAIEQINNKYSSYTKTPNEYCFLENESLNNYIHDVEVVQLFASRNRMIMGKMIMKFLKVADYESFETIHNYIDTKNKIIRKGAAAAYKDDIVIIPLNMRDGCIIGYGLGNPDWNYSSPHGAGRKYSRGEVKNSFTINQFMETMNGIYSSTISSNTIDESPFAYKDMKDIINDIAPTVRIDKIIKPIYNFKAGE